MWDDPVRSELAYNVERQRQRRQVREAEGYLALIAPPTRWGTLDPTIRDRLARRVLERLAGLSELPGEGGQVDYLRGRAYCAMQLYPAAISYLEVAADQVPPHVQACISLGRCYKRLHRMDLAISALETVIGADSHQGIVLYNLACYWSLSNRPEQAVHYLAKAIDIRPSYRQAIVDEEDFEPIRQHPAFISLMTVVI
jgi:tetratricopeptide (TPR) repeat protein